MTIIIISSFTIAWIIVIKRINSIFKIRYSPFDNALLQMRMQFIFQMQKCTGLRIIYTPSVNTVCFPYLSTNDLMNFSAISIFLSSEMLSPSTELCIDSIQNHNQYRRFQFEKQFHLL